MNHHFNPKKERERFTNISATHYSTHPLLQRSDAVSEVPGDDGVTEGEGEEVAERGPTGCQDTHQGQGHPHPKHRST